MTIAIGLISKKVAEFLLREYSLADPDFEFGDLIATAVIEKVKANVKGCGGLTWFGIVHPVSDSIAAGMPGYKDGEVVPASKKCDAFICRRQSTDAIVQELTAQELSLLPNKKDQLRDTLHSLCKKIGLVVYTDPNDPDGDGSFRSFAYWRSSEEMKLGMKIFNEKRQVERENKAGEKTTPDAWEI